MKFKEHFNFFHAVLLLTCSPTQVFYSASLYKISNWTKFFGTVALHVTSLGLKHASFSWKTLSDGFECTNHKTPKNGAGQHFRSMSRTCVIQNPNPHIAAESCRMSSKVYTLPKAKSQAKDKRAKDRRKYCLAVRRGPNSNIS